MIDDVEDAPPAEAAAEPFASFEEEPDATPFEPLECKFLGVDVPLPDPL